MRIGRRYKLESAHHLPNVLPGHKCGRNHGHTYWVEVELQGPVEPIQGWVLDYAALDAVWRDLVHAQLDHNDLNLVKGLENPTAEHVARWVWRVLSTYGWAEGINLHRIRVCESEISWAEVTAYDA